MLQFIQNAGQEFRPGSDIILPGYDIISNDEVIGRILIISVQTRDGRDFPGGHQISEIEGTNSKLTIGENEIRLMTRGNTQDCFERVQKAYDIYGHDAWMRGEIEIMDYPPLKREMFSANVEICRLGYAWMKAMGYLLQVIDSTEKAEIENLSNKVWEIGQLANRYDGYIEGWHTFCAWVKRQLWKRGFRGVAHSWDDGGFGEEANIQNNVKFLENPWMMQWLKENGEDLTIPKPRL